MKIVDTNSKKYLDFVRTLPCCHTGQTPAEPHHIIGVDKMGKMGGKNGDITAVPLSREVHEQVHRDGGQGWPQTRWLIETLNMAIVAGVIEIK